MIFAPQIEVVGHAEGRVGVLRFQFQGLLVAGASALLMAQVLQRAALLEVQIGIRLPVLLQAFEHGQRFLGLATGGQRRGNLNANPGRFFQVLGSAFKQAGGGLKFAAIHRDFPFDQLRERGGDILEGGFGMLVAAENPGEDGLAQRTLVFGKTLPFQAPIAVLERLALREVVAGQVSKLQDEVEVQGALGADLIHQADHKDFRLRHGLSSRRERMPYEVEGTTEVAHF